MKLSPKRRACLPGVLALGLVVAAPAVAQDDAGYEWSITPYLWATDTTVDLAFRDTDIGAGDISFSDLLDVLDTAFMIHMEGGRGQWSAFADLTYLETSETEQREILSVDTDSEQLFLDAAVAWWPGTLGEGLSVYGGLRYASFDDRYRFSLDDQLLGERRSDNDYTDLLLGGRINFDLSARWSLLTQADLSFGDSEGTWLVRANFGYTVGQRARNRILFGYQFKRAEFRDGDLVADYSYQGPIAGFNFMF